MRKFMTVLLLGGFAFYLTTMATAFFTDRDPSSVTSIGAKILSDVPETSGSANAVTAVVVQYRGLDTLGEVTVLFTSALGVALLAAAMKGNLLQELFADDGGFVLQVGSRVLLPFIVMVGAYITLHGHLSPGGGFPGGVLIATAGLVVVLTSKEPKIPVAVTQTLEGVAGLLFVVLGLVGLFSPAGSFLANILPKGSFGTIFSAGLIPFIYAVVAVKVASELTNVVAGLTGNETGGDR